MYAALIALHNLGRWAVLALGLYALFRAVTGLLARGGWLKADDRARRLFPVALDIQVLLGAILSAVSPLTRSAYGDMAHAMATPELRFYAVEHVAVALLALAFAHVGSVKIRKAVSPRARFQGMAVFYGLAMVVLASRIPWGRPLLPFLGG